MDLKKLFERFPRIEALVRNLYWRVSHLHRVTSGVKKGLDASSAEGMFSSDELVEVLRRMGITEDDVIVVHSSMSQLAKSGLTANGVIELLTRRLCPSGTLICPTFPLYRDEPQGTERLTKDMSNVELVYNVQKTRPWTGELGRMLMKVPGARRSLHPLNTVTAYGTAVDQIFAKESMNSLDLPCGPSSTWAALAELNAKIIMLGVDLTHSLTMIHVAEDCYEAEWPVKDWYRNRVFRVVDHDKEYAVKVRERHPKWALSYAERKLSHDLYSNGIAKRFQIGSLDVTLLESSALIDFLNSRKKLAYPYYLTWLSRL
jgi:aminoglycoside 3-N-acetyltransferase